MHKIFLTFVVILTLTFTANKSLAYERIISAGGDITEIIYSLGMEDKLVGTDTTSYFPPEANKLPKVGYRRTLSAEGILSLNPDAIIYSGEAGPKAVLEQIKSAGVKLIELEEKYSIDAIKQKITNVGNALDLKESDKFKQKTKEIAKIESEIKVNNDSIKKPKKALFIMSHSGGRALVAGKNTSGAAILEEAGLVNGASEFKGYKPMNPESKIAINPEIIVVSHPKANDKEKAEEVKKTIKNMPGIKLTQAAKSGNIFVVDSLKYIGFGPRTVEAILELQKLSYPIQN